MIDLKDLRARPDHYRTGCANKQVDVSQVDLLIELDAKLRKVLAERESITAEQNKIGKEIGAIAGRMKKATPDEKSELQAQMKALQQRPNELKAQGAQLEETLQKLQPERDEVWLKVPQPADPDVPVGTSSDDNVQLRTWNPKGYDAGQSFKENKGFTPKPHTDLIRDLEMVDFKRGVKLSGSRSYVLKGDGMRLYQAVLRYAFDYMTQQNGFTPVSAPCLVRDACMVGTGFFPHGRDEAYSVANPTSEDGLALTGTGEVGLMGLHMDEIVPAEDLPLTYTTVSTCFRREAGAAGKDTAGLYRVHQFDKVEQVVICKADEAESRGWHQKMIGFVEGLLQSLELPYRLLQCCTGDLGPKNADMIDVECWIPTRAGDDESPDAGAYGETHSASRLYDYQTRRLNLRYRDPETGKPVFAHSLNNTVAACPRLLIPILEVHQNEDGSITLPAPLVPYMHGQTQIG